MNVPIGFGLGRRVADQPAPLSTPPGTALSVLVVDDDPAVLEELALAIGRRGVTVLSAGSARMALSVLAGRPDVGVLVTDIRMPGMDGIALAEAVLAGRGEAEAIELLLVTGYASAAQGLAAGRLGAMGVLQKPVRGAALAAMVTEALAAAAARRRQAGPALREESRTDPGANRADAMAGDQADARAIEDGEAAPRPAAISAHALAGAVAERLRALGAPCSRRITLQPDGAPLLSIDMDRLLRATDLLARGALRGAPGAAELSLDAGSGSTRLDLLLRPGTPEPEPRPEPGLPVTIARGLVAALGAQLDAWTIPAGGLRARLLIQAG
jgi:CheY-like chemotaxis protein